MNLWRIFANAIVRRVVYVLVAMALAWLGLGTARAQDVQFPDQGAAYAECMADFASIRGQYPGATGSNLSYNCAQGKPPRCFNNGATTTCWYVCAIDSPNPTGSFQRDCRTRANSAPTTRYVYGGAQSCASRQPYIGPPPMSTVNAYPRQGALSCINGCEAAMFNNGDGTWTGRYDGSGKACSVQTLEQACQFMTGFHWNKWNQTCEPTEQQCDDNQAKDPLSGACKDACPEGMKLNQEGQCSPAAPECPAGNVKSPQGDCLPGEGQCAAGEARRENGTCGKDSDGDGKADEDDDDPSNDPDKESASGGDTCNAPPSCSGSAIACMQVKIQWRIDCNTRRNKNVAGGGCAAMPVCTGDNCDAVEYSQLLMQWRTACALEKMAGEGGSSGGDADLAAIKNALTGSNQGDAGPVGNPADAWAEGSGEEFNPDTSGYGWGGSCPSIPPVSVFGQTINFDIGPMCEWVALGGHILIALTAFLCLRIVGSKEA